MVEITFSSIPGLVLLVSHKKQVEVRSKSLVLPYKTNIKFSLINKSLKALKADIQLRFNNRIDSIGSLTSIVNRWTQTIAFKKAKEGCILIQLDENTLQIPFQIEPSSTLTEEEEDEEESLMKQERKKYPVMAILRDCLDVGASDKQIEERIDRFILNQEKRLASKKRKQEETAKEKKPHIREKRPYVVLQKN